MKLTLDATYSNHNYRGEIEFIIKDRYGNILETRREPNIVKIFGKEILARRLAPDKTWDPLADTGAGAWVAADPVSGTDDATSDYSVKYILFGASYDGDGLPLGTADTRYYVTDPVTNRPVPIQLTPGAKYSGSLINGVPVSEPGRPLKKIEAVSYESSYQPAGTPLMQSDVRAMNNVVILETVLGLDEYNGFGVSESDSFTITEVALAAGREILSVGTCECTPRELFLEGSSLTGNAIKVTAAGGDVVSIDPDEADVDLIKAGDQIMLVADGSTTTAPDTLTQTSPFYLVVAKLAGGRDIQLDRIPTASNSAALVGTYGVFRDTLRLFSHRILKAPLSKNGDVEITVRWRIIFN